MVPLIVTLVEHDGKSVALMVTVIPMAPATLHLKQKSPRGERGLEGFGFWVEGVTIARRLPARKPERPFPHAQIDRFAELDAVFSAARPLDPDLRDPFPQAVANALMRGLQ